MTEHHESTFTPVVIDRLLVDGQELTIHDVGTAVGGQGQITAHVRPVANRADGGLTLAIDLDQLRSVTSPGGNPIAYVAQIEYEDGVPTSLWDAELTRSVPIEPSWLTERERIGHQQASRGSGQGDTMSMSTSITPEQIVYVNLTEEGAYAVSQYGTIQRYIAPGWMAASLGFVMRALGDSTTRFGHLMPNWHSLIVDGSIHLSLPEGDTVATELTYPEA